MKQEQWSFAALDTLFFKESRPMESIGGSQLASVFPPPARTLIGAIRTTIGEALQVDWAQYAKGESSVSDVIGSVESLNPLSFTGPFLISKGERLYPMPLTYLQNEEAQTRLVPDTKVVHCDLGKVRLPVKKNNSLLGAKPVEGAFLSEDGLAQFLSGKEISEKHIYPATKLYAQEERLGIGRDYKTRSVEEGLLYQTRHIRPLDAAQLKVGIAMKGLQAELPESGTVRLGAEGRLAAWQRSESVQLPTIPAQAQATGLMLMLLTPALFERGWLPDDFQEHVETYRGVEQEGQHLVWQGTIAGIKLRLITSVVGKPVREGGWDMVKKSPRPLASYVPAGSCYFCEVLEGDLVAAQRALHGVQIGKETEYGRGEIAAGYW